MLCIFLLLGSVSSVSAVVSGSEIEQTKNTTAMLAWLFSTELLINIIFAVFVLVFTMITSKLIKWKLFGYLESANIGDEASKEEIIGVISRSVNIMVIIAWVSIALSILGVDLGIFMWGIWFGIGFTLKTFLTNFISGIIIVSQWSYHIWDLIEVGNQRWKITKINALFTELEELDGVIFNIPNIRFFEENVRNFHTNDKRRIDVEVVVDYGTDILQAKKVLQKVVSNFPMVLQAPASDVLISNLWERGVTITLRFWVNSKENFVELKSNVTETVNLAFRQTDIKIAYPQLTLSGKMEK
jgi:small conductance mechanosensitive channel